VRARRYSQDLLNNFFRHPYTRIAFLQNDLGAAGFARAATPAKYPRMSIQLFFRADNWLSE